MRYKFSDGDEQIKTTSHFPTIFNTDDQDLGNKRKWKFPLMRQNLIELVLLQPDWTIHLIGTSKIPGYNIFRKRRYIKRGRRTIL